MNERGLVCKRCNSTNTVMFVNFMFLIPTSKLYQVNKADFRKKEFELWGADYKPRDYVCKNCGYVTFVNDYET